MIYAGIGSRETPQAALDLIEKIADRLADKDWICRTGGAEGADDAFWRGCGEPHRCEVYLPWKSFNGWGDDLGLVARWEAQHEAYAIAEQFHPSWKFLSYGAKKLHARNVHQIYGYDVTEPHFSDCVVCWTKNGKGAGGTGQALRIAKHHEIPIYDLGSPLTWRLFSDIVGL